MDFCNPVTCISDMYIFTGALHLQDLFLLKRHCKSFIVNTQTTQALQHVPDWALYVYGQQKLTSVIPAIPVCAFKSDATCSHSLSPSVPEWLISSFIFCFIPCLPLMRPAMGRFCWFFLTPCRIFVLPAIKQDTHLEFLFQPSYLQYFNCSDLWTCTSSLHSSPLLPPCYTTHALLIRFPSSDSISSFGHREKFTACCPSLGTFSFLSCCCRPSISISASACQSLRPRAHSSIAFDNIKLFLFHYHDSTQFSAVTLRWHPSFILLSPISFTYSPSHGGAFYGFLLSLTFPPFCLLFACAATRKQHKHVHLGCLVSHFHLPGVRLSSMASPLITNL